MSGWIVLPILALLVLPAFLLGGVHTLTHASIGLLAGTLAFFLLFRMKTRSGLTERRLQLDAWFWLLLAALVFTTCQLVPLPLSWFATLAPSTDRVFRHTLGSLGLYDLGAWQPLSLAPPQSVAKLLKDIAVLLVYVVVLQWASQRPRVRLLMRVSVLSAVVMCGLILFQTLLRIPQPWMGLYSSFDASAGTWPTLLLGSPFLNPNHLAGFLLFNTLLALPLFINNINPAERWGWGLAFGLLSINLFLTLSPWAIFLYVLALLAFSGFLGYRLFTENPEDPTVLDPAYAPLPFLNVSPATAERLSAEQAIPAYPSHKPATTPDPSDPTEPIKKKKTKKNYQRSSRDPKPIWKGWKWLWQRKALRLAFAGVVVILGLGMSWAAHTLRTHLRPKVQETSLSTRDSLVISGQLLQHYPLWGTGRGATPLAWPRFTSAQSPWLGQKTLTHVESQWLQPLVDWGIPFGLAFVLCILWLLWRLFQRGQGMMERGIWLAIVILFLHNLHDFNLAFLGTGLPWILFIAALVRLQDSRTPCTQRYPLFSLGILAGIGLLAILALTPYARRYELPRLAQHMSALHNMTPEQQQSHLRRLFRHVPSDYLLASFLTQHYITPRFWNAQQALTWSRIGLFLNPTAAEIHLMRGYLFARNQAFEKATAALAHSVLYRPALLEQAAQTVFQFNFADKVLRHSPTSHFAVEIFKRWHLCREQAERCEPTVIALQQRFPRVLSVQQQLTLLYTWRIANELARTPQLPPATLRPRLEHYQQRIQQQLENIRRLSPQDSESFHSLIAGNLALYQGNTQQAIAHFQRVLAQQQGHEWPAFLKLYPLYVRTSNTPSLQALWKQGRSLFHDPKQIAWIAYQEGQWLELQGQYQQAMTRYGEATQLDPQDKYWLATAELCKRLKEYACTLRIYQNLSQKPQYHYLKPEIEKLKPSTIMPP